MSNGSKGSLGQKHKVVIAIVVLLSCLQFFPNVQFPIREQEQQIKKSSLLETQNDDDWCSIDQLMQLLHDDPQRNAFRQLVTQPPRPWANRNEFLKCLFPAMDWQLVTTVFFRHRMVFLGDSTLRSFVRWLQVLYKVRDELDDFPSWTLEEGRQRIKAAAITNETASGGGGTQLCSNIKPEPFIVAAHNNNMNDSRTNDDDYYNIHMEFHGISGMNLGKKEIKILNRAWNKTNEIQPEIVVVNMGLHWLHYMGYGKDVTSNQIIHWIEYEEWLQECVNHALHNGVKILVFKTSNHICDDMFHSDFAEGNRLYQSQDPVTLKECQENVTRILQADNYTTRIPPRQGKSHNAQQEQEQQRHMIMQYCTKGVLNQMGVSYLNQRLYEFVHNYHHIQEQNHEQRHKDDLHVIIFDDARVQPCNYTLDGRHYCGIILLRLRLLANLLYPIILDW